MYNIDQKYNYRTGTHCWYCKREYNDTDRIKTKDHIRPQWDGGRNHVMNYIGACLVCNAAKADLSLIDFAEEIAHVEKKHPLYKLKHVVAFQCWKLYNKTNRKLTELHKPKLYKF